MEQYKEAVFRKLITLSVPSEDKIWYDLLNGDLSDMLIDVFEGIRSQGHRIGISGERDSFGWVTKGIFLDGECMCLI